MLVSTDMQSGFIRHWHLDTATFAPRLPLFLSSEIFLMCRPRVIGASRRIYKTNRKNSTDLESETQIGSAIHPLYATYKIVDPLDPNDNSTSTCKLQIDGSLAPVNL